jgi:hypothetical protein
MDMPAVIRQQYWISPAVGPGPLFNATQRAVRKLTGRDAGCYPALAWPCPGCGQQVTDLAPGGRPIHSELGHGYFARQAERGQAKDPQRLADQLIVVFDGAIVQAVMGTIAHSDSARSAVQALLDAHGIP